MSGMEHRSLSDAVDVGHAAPSDTEETCTATCKFGIEHPWACNSVAGMSITIDAIDHLDATRKVHLATGDSFTGIGIDSESLSRMMALPLRHICRLMVHVSLSFLMVASSTLERTWGRPTR